MTHPDQRQYRGLTTNPIAIDEEHPAKFDADVSADLPVENGANTGAADDRERRHSDPGAASRN